MASTSKSKPAHQGELDVDAGTSRLKTAKRVGKSDTPGSTKPASVMSSTIDSKNNINVGLLRVYPKQVSLSL